ncbi:MAG: hypothetical protein U0136_13775 [Bdellovibrionota bacterium]
MRFSVPLTALLIFTYGIAVLPAHADDSRLGAAADLVKQHVQQVMQEEKQYESYGQQISQQVATDSRSGNVQGKQAAKQHPWDPMGNLNSGLDYFLDSFFNLDARPINVMNWSQAWSCFEPKLLAYAKKGAPIVDAEGGGNEDLIAECRHKCINHVDQIPEERGSLIGAIKYKLIFGCLADPDPWGYTENGYEVVEYWFPEYQVSINNFGINRIRPETLSGTGGQFTRQALLSQKEGSEQQELQQLASAYPLSLQNYKPMPGREPPLKGQGVWGGYAFPDFEDKSYAHVIRTWLSTTMGDQRKKTDAGWEVDPEFSVYDALPKPRWEHDPVNVWTEHGMFDVLTSIPQFSWKVRPDLMQGLFGQQQPYMQAAKQPKPFWQSQGAMAYRVAKWGDSYAPLQKIVGVKGNADESIKEAVYRGGYELFPLVTNGSGFGTPTISAAAVFARRALYIAGANQQNGDQSGMIEKFFPQGAQMGRIMTYTINIEDKAREIDKMQLTSPKRPHDGTTFGGIPPMLSECFRSQNIPNLVNKDQKLEQWVNNNLSRKLPGYYSDIDFISPQGGDITFTYWNRRIGCFCDRCGKPFGSTPTNDGGDGDKLYDRPRQPICRYPLLPQMTAWSAWAREDTLDRCLANGLNEGFYDGTGLKDAV